MINILIGIGGTGAKVVESTLYLMAAGIGDADRILVALVDQDNGNGNLARTNALVERLRALRDDWDHSDGNKLDWAATPEAGGTRFLRTRIEPLFKRTAHWRPTDADQGTLAQILKKSELPPAEKSLFDLLFRGEAASERDAEQTMDLTEGYRGRAHVGSAALLSSLLIDNTELADRIVEEMQKTTQGEDVRIFLAGSIFGGTGAAGFPTLARKIDNLRKATVAPGERQIDPERVSLGGVIMLPYFGFQDGEPGANVVRAGDLLPQSRVALNYYHRLFEREPLFDRFYLSGWNELIRLNYHSAGSDTQHNPPMIPELVGALAAIDFLAASEIEPSKAPLASARQDKACIEWADLPASQELRVQIEDLMGQMIRTALWWRYRMEPAFDSRHKPLFGKEELRVGAIKQPWLRALAAGTVWDQATQDARARLTVFFEGLLDWAAAMELFISPEQGDAFRLWLMGPLLEVRNRADPTKPVMLKPAPLSESPLEDEKLAKTAFDGAMRSPDKARKVRTAETLYAELNQTPPQSAARGMGKVLAAVHRAARP